MKSKLGSREIVYPTLMEHNLCGEHIIVLMSEPGVGMVVWTNGNEGHYIGEYRDNWAMEVCGRNFFHQYHGVVMIEK